MDGAMLQDPNWTPEENTRFEHAIADYGHDATAPNYWENMAKAVGGTKTLEEVKKHHKELSEDLKRIAAGKLPLYYYPPFEFTSSRPCNCSHCSSKASKKLGKRKFGDKKEAQELDK